MTCFFFALGEVGSWEQKFRFFKKNRIFILASVVKTSRIKIRVENIFTFLSFIGSV